MREKIYEEMMSYLANATKEQLAEDCHEISTNHEGPLASDYVETVLVFSHVMPRQSLLVTRGLGALELCSLATVGTQERPAA